MRVIFFGTADFAVPSLERLAGDRHIIVMCVTQPDRPQGRGLAPAPSPVKRAATTLGVLLSQPERPRAELFQSLQPDVGVVIAYGQLIRNDLLTLPSHGMFGVHPSLLPKYRGAAPVAWALLNGETTTGVSIFRLTERLDAGEIASQQPVTIDPQEDAEALIRRLAHLGAAELLRVLDALEAGRLTLRPQDESQATSAPKLTKVQGQVDWRQSAETIARLVRATNPWPGATTHWQGSSLKVWRVSLADAGQPPHDVEPGTVVHVAADWVDVTTGSGILRLHEVQPAGRRRMTIREFMAGHPLKVGERFGSQDA
jgi:methionyl-tRNA formyltransferase